MSYSKKKKKVEWRGRGRQCIIVKQYLIHINFSSMNFSRKNMNIFIKINNFPHLHAQVYNGPNGRQYYSLVTPLIFTGEAGSH